MEKMNEVMEVETMEMENYDVELDETCESNGGLGKVVIGVVLGGIALAGAAAVKNKDKIKAKLTERKIAKLEKQGYVVVSPETNVEAEQEFNEEVIEPVETEEA